MQPAVAGARPAYPVVVLTKDGARKKGVAGPFDPRGASYVVREVGVGGLVVDIHDISVPNIEAVFFVRDLGLLRTSRETIARSPVSPPSGTRLRVTLRHGETIEGVSPGYDPHARGFLLYPDGPRNRSSNVASVYIVRIPALRVEVLDETPAVTQDVPPIPEPPVEVKPTSVSLNTATLEQLTDELGLRRNVAEGLVAMRSERPFQTWARVSEVRGVGPVTLEKLRAKASL